MLYVYLVGWMRWVGCLYGGEKGAHTTLPVPFFHTSCSHKQSKQIPTHSSYPHTTHTSTRIYFNIIYLLPSFTLHGHETTDPIARKRGGFLFGSGSLNISPTPHTNQKMIIRQPKLRFPPKSGLGLGIWAKIGPMLDQNWTAAKTKTIQFLV